ncbi:Uncharacterised protein [Klebsiella pneumoniae]|nr:Uncharacterised protein [Klebsiella pneumoniae]
MISLVALRARITPLCWLYIIAGCIKNVFLMTVRNLNNAHALLFALWVLQILCKLNKTTFLNITHWDVTRNHDAPWILAAKIICSVSCPLLCVARFELTRFFPKEF